MSAWRYHDPRTRLDMLPGHDPDGLSTDVGSLTGKIVLVTGGRGALGTSLSRRLRSSGARVIRLGRRSPIGDSFVTEPAVPWDVIGDVREPAVWTTLPETPDVIFHFAAQTSVRVADEHPADDWQANVRPMLGLLETCRDSRWRPTILFAGSVTEVGIPDRSPVDESFADRPVTMYDRHKLMAEAYLEHYVQRGWARGATLRLPNIYGPGPASGSKDRGILNEMMRKALAGEPLTRYGDGHQVRDYLFVDDAVDAFLAAAVHVERINGEHFVLGSGVGHTIAQAFELVADRAEALTGRRVPVNTVEPPVGLSPIEDRSFVADASRFRRLTGWSPRTTLSDGIDLTLRSFSVEQAART